MGQFVREEYISKGSIRISLRLHHVIGGISNEFYKRT